MTHLNKTFISLALVAAAAVPFIAKAQTNPPGDKEWIAKSNANAKLLLDIDKKYSPEFGSSQGLAFYDTLITVPTVENTMAERKEDMDVVALLKRARQKETDTKVKQDIDIIINHVELGFRQDDFNLYKKIAYMNATGIVFSGLQTLLDDQTPVERRKAAVIRLAKYAGMANGYQPTTVILQARIAAQMQRPDMIYPSKQQMEVELQHNGSIVSGIADLFKKYKLTGWEQSYTTIKKQLEDYDAWITANVLPKARTDFRLPPEEYKLALEGYGIDIPPTMLAKMAHAAFTDIQNQMKPLAEQVAKKYNLPSSGYRDVIKFLKKNQIIGDSIMPIYRRHLTDIEAIIREQHLVTLPNARPLSGWPARRKPRSRLPRIWCRRHF